jgi:hypothetical protein
MGQLPEQAAANLATLQRLQLEQQTVSEGLRRATDVLSLLESTASAPGGLTADSSASSTPRASRSGRASPNRGLFAPRGALAGLLLGAGVAVSVDRLDPTLRDADETAGLLGLPLPATIPFVRPKDRRRLAAMWPADDAPPSHATNASQRPQPACTPAAAEQGTPGLS